MDDDNNDEDDKDQVDIKDDGDDYYGRDLAKALNREILGLVAHGCSHIQVNVQGGFFYWPPLKSFNFKKYVKPRLGKSALT